MRAVNTGLLSTIRRPALRDREQNENESERQPKSPGCPPPLGRLWPMMTLH